MKNATKPFSCFLFNFGEFLPFLRLVLPPPMYDPLIVQGKQDDLMYDLAPTTLFSSDFKIFFFLFHLVLFSHWTGFISSAPTHLLSNWIRVWLHHGKKICHFIFQYNQEQMCPAPICPFGGNLAMLQRYNCANRVGRSQRQWDLELCNNRTSVV